MKWSDIGPFVKAQIFNTESTKGIYQENINIYKSTIIFN